MNVDSYWADEDDWDDEFCYREISPFDNSAASMTLGAFMTAAQNAGVGTAYNKAHVDYAEAERKLAWSNYRTPDGTECELKDAQIVRSTDKALMVTTPALNAPAWIPKSIIISYTPLTIPMWFAQKLLDTDITATSGDFEGLCPYCGEQHCDCGKEINSEGTDS